MAGSYCGYRLRRQAPCPWQAFLRIELKLNVQEEGERLLRAKVDEICNKYRVNGWCCFTAGESKKFWWGNTNIVHHKHLTFAVKNRPIGKQLTSTSGQSRGGGCVGGLAAAWCLVVLPNRSIRGAAAFKTPDPRRSSSRVSNTQDRAHREL